MQTKRKSAEILRHVNDPEHPLTLEQLKVMTLENIHVDDANSRVKVYFTPTIPHCRYVQRERSSTVDICWCTITNQLRVSIVWRR